MYMDDDREAIAEQIYEEGKEEEGKGNERRNQNHIWKLE